MVLLFCLTVMDLITGVFLLLCFISPIKHFSHVVAQAEILSSITYVYYWHKVKHVLKFGTNFLTHLIEQTYFISTEQKSILTLASYALIHKILILCICLMHNLSKT